MTAVLQLRQDIARPLDVHTTATPEQLADLVEKRTLDDSPPVWMSWRSLARQRRC